MARTRVKKIRREEALYKKKLEAAAMKIQAIYRGHRGRLSTHIKMAGIRERKRRLEEAAIKVQTLYRGRYAKKTVFKLKLEKSQLMFANARLWLEHWDDDTQSWYYYNSTVRLLT